jgi:hypothetical protein
MLGSNVENERPAMFSRAEAERGVNAAWSAIQEHRVSKGLPPETEEFRTALIDAFSSPRKPLAPELEELAQSIAAKYRHEHPAA